VRGLSASDVVHPFDEAARRRLDTMTGLPTSRPTRQLAGARRLGPAHRPELHRLLPPICVAFGIPEPELYVAPGEVDVETFGDTRPAIVISGGLADLLAPDEVEAVLAHECGHILLRHVRYRSMARWLEAAPDVAVPAEVRSALTDWSHTSELSADRAAAAYLGDADAMTRVMFRFAGAGIDPPLLAVRVREVQAFTATAGFARLATPVPG
jgi:Zn-dependent protease with chaperone function